MPEFGTFYFNTSESFPAVVIKEVDAQRVLVRVWTDSGDRTEVAERSDSPGIFSFVSG